MLANIIYICILITGNKTDIFNYYVPTIVKKLVFTRITHYLTLKYYTVTDNIYSN